LIDISGRAKLSVQLSDHRWGIELKDSRIYEILDSLNLSHQKAHRDYANADSSRQQQFVETLKKNSNPSSKRKK
jgi:transposase